MSNGKEGLNWANMDQEVGVVAMDDSGATVARIEYRGEYSGLGERKYVATYDGTSIEFDNFAHAVEWCEDGGHGDQYRTGEMVVVQLYGADAQLERAARAARLWVGEPAAYMETRVLSLLGRMHARLGDICSRVAGGEGRADD